METAWMDDKLSHPHFIIKQGVLHDIMGQLKKNHNKPCIEDRITEGMHVMPPKIELQIRISFSILPQKLNIKTIS